MFETILVPTDGSDHARKAVFLASDIASKYKARLVFLHVSPKGPLSDEIRRMAQVENLVSESASAASEGMSAASSVFGKTVETEEQTQQVLQFLADNILTDAKRIAKENGVEEVSGGTADGDPAEQILKRAEKEGANLIVMGSRGLSDLKGLLMGSVSHKVSQLSPCTCVTVK